MAGADDRIKCLANVWVYQEAHGAIPEEPVLYASKDEAERALTVFAKEEKLPVESNPGGLYAGEGGDTEARTWGPLCAEGAPPSRTDAGAYRVGCVGAGFHLGTSVERLTNTASDESKRYEEYDEPIDTKEVDRMRGQIREIVLEFARAQECGFDLPEAAQIAAVLNIAIDKLPGDDGEAAKFRDEHPDENPLDEIYSESLELLGKISDALPSAHKRG